MFDPEFQKRLVEAGTEILNKIGVDSQMKYMKNGGIVGSRLSIRTGDLVRAVLGVGKGKIRDVIVGENEAVFSIGVDVDVDKGTGIPYARLHELGGVMTVNQAMRRFFWYKYKSTGDRKWKVMSGKSSLYFPKREYLRPAVYDNVNFIKQVLENKVGEYLKFTITRIITGQAKAGNLQQG